MATRAGAGPGVSRSCWCMQGSSCRGQGGFSTHTAGSIDPCYTASSCSLAALPGARRGSETAGSNWTPALVSGLRGNDNIPLVFQAKEHTQGPGGLQPGTLLFGQKKREEEKSLTILRPAGQLQCVSLPVDPVTPEPRWK